MCQGGGDFVGGVPGQGAQQVCGGWLEAGDLVQGDVPDLGNGTFGGRGGRALPVHVRRVLGEQPQIGTWGDEGVLREVGGGLLDGQGQMAELFAQFCGAVQVPGTVAERW